MHIYTLFILVQCYTYHVRKLNWTPDAFTCVKIYDIRKRDTIPLSLILIQTHLELTKIQKGINHLLKIRIHAVYRMRNYIMDIKYCIQVLHRKRYFLSILHV